jgi:methylated-DNA-[protein]-cysteine S-methyltransferase
MPYFWRQSTSLGVLTLVSEADVLTGLWLGASPPPAGATEQATSFLTGVAREIGEYLVGRRRVFDFPFAPRGTVFQEAVWQALCAIPYGQTRSYQEVAASLGRPQAARAVGGACHSNPLLLAIPCHRVIGKDNSLIGFAAGLSVKAQLLALESEGKGIL